MRVLAINGRAFLPSLLRQALKDAVGSGPALEFIVENTGYYKVIQMDYHGGEKYPQFERVPGSKDRLDDVVIPMVK